MNKYMHLWLDFWCVSVCVCVCQLCGRWCAMHLLPCAHWSKAKQHLVPPDSILHHRHPHAAQQMGTQPSGENLYEDLMARHMLSTKRNTGKMKAADKVNFSNEHIRNPQKNCLSAFPCLYYCSHISSHLPLPLWGCALSRGLACSQSVRIFWKLARVNEGDFTLLLPVTIHLQQSSTLVQKHSVCAGKAWNHQPCGSLTVGMEIQPIRLLNSCNSPLYSTKWAPCVWYNLIHSHLYLFSTSSMYCIWMSSYIFNNIQGLFCTFP